MLEKLITVAICSWFLNALADSFGFIPEFKTRWSGTEPRSCSTVTPDHPIYQINDPSNVFASKGVTKDAELFKGGAKVYNFIRILNQHGQRVKKVVLIDNKPENVNSVQSAMQNRGFRVCGIKFASKDLSRECPADKNWVEYQFHHLKENKYLVT